MNGARARVVIVGGGFGGLYAARRLGSAPADVTLLDRRNFHLFQPLLYQVATGALSPANIAAPLRAILKRNRNTRVLLADVTGFDVARRRVVATSGEFAYDTLVVATGVRHQYFGHAEWEAAAPGLKTLEDAVEMRRRILLAFERAEEESDPAERRKLLTFVIVGAGPTGAELAGALGEIARHTLRREFRTIDPAEARILLVEGGPRVLATYPPALSEKAKDSLASLGVETLLDASVTAVEPGRVTISRAGRTEEIETETVLWAAGVAASPLAAALAAATGAATDRAGRIAVEPDLTLPGHPEIFVLGDMATLSNAKGRPLPGVAPVAMQQGRYAARAIAARLAGRAVSEPFRYKDRGSMATIGRGRAIAEIGFLRLSGYPAWLAWLFIHLMYLVQFGNRVLILVQWAWNYLTWNRSARLITPLVALLFAAAPTLAGVEHFAYDPKAPLDTVTAGVETRGDVVIQDLSYASPKGGRVPAYLVVPPGKGPFAAVVWGHWYWENSPMKSRRQFLDEAVVLARSGVVSLLTDGPVARAGYVPDRTPLNAKQFDDLVQQVVDMRRGADLLLARPDVEPRRLAFVGHSYNATVGAILAGVDRRFTAFVLMAGGLSDRVDDRSEEIKRYREKVGPARWDAFLAEHAWADPGPYVARAGPAAVFLQFAAQEDFLTPARAKEYAANVSEPKRFKLYAAPHALNAEARRDRLAFLAGILGVKPPDPAAVAAVPDLVQPPPPR